MDFMSNYTKIGLAVLIGLLIAFLTFPSFGRMLTRVLNRSETVTVPGVGPDGPQELKIVTLLGFDGIPAILDPLFVSAGEANEWMEPDEQVLGLTINGDARAYSVRMLSRHEIVNDVVGGVPVAVTW